MEHVEDEAFRIRELAEKMFKVKDLVGAKKLALKAQNLFPELDGIEQMIATLDIYLASEVKAYGEKDWYAILGLDASADVELLKKQYRKLALMLHPDKNKSFGAEGAFTLISDAWSVLSDKTKKMIYDQKRYNKGFQQKSFPSKDSIPSAANVFHSPASTGTSRPRPQKNNSTCTPPAAQRNVHTLNSSSFWTSCFRCKMHYEYLRIYLNRNLLCQKCKLPFIALEIELPANGQPVLFSSPQQHQSNYNHISSNTSDCAPRSTKSSLSGKGISGCDVGGQHLRSCSSKTSGVAGEPASSISTPVASVNLHSSKEMRREYDEQQAGVGREREEALHKKNMSFKMDVIGNANSSPNDNSTIKQKRGIVDEAGNEKGVVSKQRTGASRIQRANGDFVDVNRSRASSKQNNLPSFTQMEIRKMLVEMTRSTINKKLEEWNSALEEKAKERGNAKKKQKVDDSNKEKMKNETCPEETDVILLDQNKTGTKEDSSKKNSSNVQRDNADESVSIAVPDSDFYDFDKDRIEHAFGSDQLWATYDEEDGMPRYYAFLQKVISLKPFKVRMSFLTSKSNSEFGSLDWVASGFAKTCGEFRISKYEIVDAVNIFSHKMRWEKGPRGIIKIFPRKTEIWALYRNWSPEWNEHTSEDIIYKYDMVEVMSDYTDEQGILIAPLVKVPGFKAIFCCHKDPMEFRTIIKEEMFRFSHQVLSRVLTGSEAENSPKGCYELDPAATPLELLQVVTEPKTSGIVEAAEEPDNKK